MVAVAVVMVDTVGSVPVGIVVVVVVVVVVVAIMESASLWEDAIGS